MFFISFEGPEGSGKTTTILKLKTKLTALNKKIIFTREPGGCLISEAIRLLILDKNNKMMNPWTEFLLYLAARKQHLVEKILPYANDDVIVICDRFTDSTIAYQGFARKLDIAEIIKIQNTVLANFTPNLTILFNITPEVGLARIKNRQNKNNRLDDESLKFHQRVYEGYQLLAKTNQERIKVVDANQNIDQLVATVFTIIAKSITSL